MALSGITVTAFRKQVNGIFFNSGSVTTNANGDWEMFGLDENETYAYRFSDPTGAHVTVYKGSSGPALSLDDAATYPPSSYTGIYITMYGATSQGGTVT